jgi:hypothetical protein
MQSINSNGNGTMGTMTTLTKLILIALLCIVINIPLYFLDEKWVAGWFTGTWIGASVLTFLYNYGFNLNITSYSLSTLLNMFLFPILTYAFWMISIYWLVSSEIDLNENPNDSHISRNIAAIFTAVIPFLAIVVTILYKMDAIHLIFKGIVGSIIVFIFGLFFYYLNVLRTSCANGSNCWAYAGWSTFLSFIITTIVFTLLSFVNIPNAFLKMFQIFPKNFTDNLSAPMNIFSIIMYVILWISSIIVFFRHDATFGDEEGDPVNISFTVIAILSLIILFIKQFDFASKFITRLIQLFMNTEFSPYTILLHAAIIFSILFGINITTTSLNKTGWNNNPSILAIFICTLVVIIFYIGILYYNY